MTPEPPLANRYGAGVAIALLALCPYIVLTTASAPLRPVLQHDLHTSAQTLQLAEGMANAGYALGAVFAAMLAQRVVSRHLFLIYETVFVVGSVLAAAAPNGGLFFAGRILQGTSTGLLLVSALPPLITRFGIDKLPRSVAIVNVGLFGATTLGPIIGGPVAAAAGAGRLLFAGVAVLGALGLLAGLLGYARFDPFDPARKPDVVALGLAAAATGLPFFATSILTSHSLTSPLFLVTFVAGLLALATLVVVQYRRRDPLMPVRALSSQLPVTGTIVAMIAGAVFITLLDLTQTYLHEVAGRSPASAGLLFWPMPLGLIVAAVLFGRLFRTRYLPVLVNVGLLALGAGAALLLLLGPGRVGPVTSGASALLGFGAGATVAPGLFLAALGVRSSLLGRAFALVELLRSEAAFAVAPIVAYLVQRSTSPEHGVRGGLIAMLVLTAVGVVASLLIPLFSGARLRQPDLRAWLEQQQQGLPSPRTMVHARWRISDDSAEPLLGRVGRRGRPPREPVE